MRIDFLHSLSANASYENSQVDDRAAARRRIHLISKRLSSHLLLKGVRP